MHHAVSGASDRDSPQDGRDIIDSADGVDLQRVEVAAEPVQQASSAVNHLLTGGIVRFVRSPHNRRHAA